MYIDDCAGTKKLIKNPENYGIVIGNKTGIVTAVSEKNGVLEISYLMNFNSETLHITCSQKKEFKIDNEIIPLKFNLDGTAVGKNKKKDDVFILIGQKLTDYEVIAKTRNKSEHFNTIAMNMVTRNKLPGHDAPTWYYHETFGYVQISFVFPLDFVHPLYGPQDHVRIFIFKRQNNKWIGIEDNSSVIHY